MTKLHTENTKWRSTSCRRKSSKQLKNVVEEQIGDNMNTKTKTHRKIKNQQNGKCNKERKNKA